MPSSSLMQWHSLLSAQRFAVNEAGQSTKINTPLAEEHTGSRSDFHIDHDRVVFSSAFRRLGRKTQVHPLARHDHIHNRLTHSVEVGCVGRSLGNRVGSTLSHAKLLPEGFSPTDIGTIVQVACLAHDIGNPPFGHTGEDALRDWFLRPEHAAYLTGMAPQERADIQTYEGNAHGLRIVSSLEMYAQNGGMRLSCAVLGTLIKYPWTLAASPPACAKKKFSLYRTELALFEKIANELGLIKQGEEKWARHPLSYLMEAADDICYAILDLEDAVEIGILDMQEFAKPFQSFPQSRRLEETNPIRQKCARLRGSAIDYCVTEVARTFILHLDALLLGTFPGKELINLCDTIVQDALFQAKELATQKVYRHRSKLITELAAYPCIAVLLDCLIPAVHALQTQGPHTLRSRDQLALKLITDDLPHFPDLYTAYMHVLDFVGSMTDNTATQLARELTYQIS